MSAGRRWCGIAAVGVAVTAITDVVVVLLVVVAGDVTEESESVFACRMMLS